MAGVLGKGLVTGILYGFDIDNRGIYYGNLNTFETDNSKCCMSCSYIEMGLVTYYTWLGYGIGRYHNHDSRSIVIWIRIGNIIKFCFSF